MIFIDLRTVPVNLANLRLVVTERAKSQTMVYCHAGRDPKFYAVQLGLPIAAAHFYQLAVWDAVTKAMEDRNAHLVSISTEPESIGLKRDSFSASIAITSERCLVGNCGVIGYRSPDYWDRCALSLIQKEDQILSLRAEIDSELRKMVL